MAGLPWSKWFWSDWRSDPGLRSCSAHARGVWMDCLCIAAESDPTGYVLVNGRPPTITDLARLTGEPEAAVQSALEELERNGVFSRDRKGRIFNRRMVRDTRDANEGRKWANKRWQQEAEKKKKNRDPIREPTGGATENPHAKKPEAREEEAGSKTEPSPETTEPSKAAPPLYAFVGKIVRLTFKDFETWRTAYHGILDLTAELVTLDAYYDAELTGDDRRKWFIRCAAALGKKHQQALAERAKAEAEARRPITERYPNEGMFG